MGLDLSNVIVSTGTAFLGFVGGAIKKSWSLENKFNKRIDERLETLEKEVAECRKRDGHLTILTLGMKMVVPELSRIDKGNPVLKHVADAFSALPSTVDTTLDDLMKKLHEID